MEGRIKRPGRRKPLKRQVHGQPGKKKWSQKGKKLERAFNGLFCQSYVIKHLIGETMFTLNILRRSEAQRTNKNTEHKNDAKMNMLFHG